MRRHVKEIGIQSETDYKRKEGRLNLHGSGGGVQQSELLGFWTSI
jgi:hypothetical protein